MKLTIYGRDVVLRILVVTLVLDIIALVIPNEVAKISLLAVSVFLIAFTLFFFRDPERTLPLEIKQNEVISPADGKIILIEEIDEIEFLKSKAKLIGIFLSPLNVHVNRIPVSGKVEYYQHVKGGFMAAYRHKSSEENERAVIGINTSSYKLLFRQIAGFVARRIVCDLRVGSEVQAGRRFGMIKFGSRVDVVIPLNSNIKVSVNQKVTGGETILAEVLSA